MPLKKASNKIQVLELDGSQVHLRVPRKSDWDEYADGLFEKTGEVTTANSSRAIKRLYRSCIVKLANVEDENGVVIPEITDPDKIVEFIAGLEGIESGRKIDAFLLGLGELDKEEEKNSSGQLAAL